MRYPSAYYLLLIYLTVICKPILPIVQDLYEHAFNEVEHLATVHHQNGMNHAKFEVGKMAKEDGATNNSPKPKSSDEVAFHFLAENKLAFRQPDVSISLIYFDRPKQLSTIYSPIQLPPPKL